LYAVATDKIVNGDKKGEVELNIIELSEKMKNPVDTGNKNYSSHQDRSDGKNTTWRYPSSA